MDERFSRANSMAAGTRSIDHYVLGKTLGIGSFGKVKCKFPELITWSSLADLRYHTISTSCEVNVYVHSVSIKPPYLLDWLNLLHVVGNATLGFAQRCKKNFSKQNLTLRCCEKCLQSAGYLSQEFRVRKGYFLLNSAFSCSYRQWRCTRRLQ